MHAGWRHAGRYCHSEIEARGIDSHVPHGRIRTQREVRMPHLVDRAVEGHVPVRRLTGRAIARIGPGDVDANAIRRHLARVGRAGRVGERACLGARVRRCLVPRFRYARRGRFCAVRDPATDGEPRRSQHCQCPKCSSIFRSPVHGYSREHTPCRFFCRAYASGGETRAALRTTTAVASCSVRRTGDTKSGRECPLGRSRRRRK